MTAILQFSTHSAEKQFIAAAGGESPTSEVIVGNKTEAVVAIAFPSCRKSRGRTSGSSRREQHCRRRGYRRFASVLIAVRRTLFSNTALPVSLLHDTLLNAGHLPPDPSSGHLPPSCWKSPRASSPVPDPKACSQHVN